MVTMSEARPSHRTIRQAEAPCFVLKTEGNHVSQPKKDTMSDLVNRVIGVSESAKEIKRVVSGILLEPQSTLPTSNFLPVAEFTATEEKLSFAANNFVLTLKEHYILLSKLVKHTDYARKNDKIGTQGSNTLKEKLENIENQLFQIMCDIKIALIGQSVDAQITVNYEVSSAFKNAATSHYKETRRAYALMNDCQDVMDFLKTMYAVMN